VANTSSSHAQLKSADFDFGDGSTAENVTPASDSTVSVTHEYDQAKSYDVQATVNFTVTGQNGEKSVKSVQCTCHVQVTPKPTPAAPTKPTKPTKPAPKQPQAPQQLPNTGAGDVLGLFGAASLIGGIGYRIFLSRRFLRG
jgi:PKD repeat protein